MDSSLDHTEMSDLSGVEKPFFLQTVSTVSIEAHPVLKAVWDGSVKLLRTLIDGGLVSVSYQS